MRLIVDLGERDKSSGLFFTDFSDTLKLKEVVIGAKSDITSLDIRNAFGANEELKITTARLAFQDFQVVTQRAKHLQQ